MLKKLGYAQVFTVLSMVLNFLLVFIVIRWYGLIAFGVFALALNYYNLFSALNFGVVERAFSLQCIEDSWQSKFYNFKIGFYILLYTSAVVSFVVLVVFYIYSNADVSCSSCYFNLGFILTALLTIPTQVVLSFYRSINRLDLVKLLGLLVTISQVLVVCFIYYSRIDFDNLGWVFGAVQVIISYFFYYQAHRLLLSRSVSNVKILRADAFTFIKKSIPFFLIGISSMIIWNSDNLILSYFGNDLVVGLYSVYFRFFSLFNTLGSLIIVFLMPFFSKFVKNGKFKVLQLLMNALVRVLCTLSFVYFIVLVVFWKEILRVYLNTHDTGEVPEYILLIFFLYSIALIFNSIQLAILSSVDRIRSFGIVVLSEAIINVILSILMYYYFGVYGVPLATLIAVILVSGFFTYRLFKARLSISFLSNYKSFFVIIFILFGIILLNQLFVSNVDFWFKMAIVFCETAIILYFVKKHLFHLYRLIAL